MVSLICTVEPVVSERSSTTAVVFSSSSSRLFFYSCFCFVAEGGKAMASASVVRLSL